MKAAYRTYGQFRGFGDVITTTGQGNDTPARSETAYYRGMSDDNDATAVTLTDSQGGSHDDADQLAGDTLETTSYAYSASPAGAISYAAAGSTIDSYWVSAAAASRARDGLPALTANMTGQVEAWSRTALHNGTTTSWRDTETDTSYDAGVTDADFGLPVYTYAHGDLSLTGDSQVRCTVSAYEPPSATGNITGLVAQAETVAEPCGGTSPAGRSAPTAAEVNALAAPAAPSSGASVVSGTCTVYDDPAAAQAWAQGTTATAACPAAAPAKGDVSEVLTASGYSAASGFTWQPESADVYDSLGRVTAAYDAMGRETQTAYTANSTGLTIKVTTTNPLNQSSSVILDPARGLTTGTSDLNGITTTLNYDVLGRVTAEWAQGLPTSAPANAKFAYNVTNTAPSSVTASVLNDDQGYATSTTIYDSLLRVRQTQDPTPQGGRLVTDTFYDTRGWKAKVNSGWWDSANGPSGTLATVSGQPIPDSQVPNQTDYAYDGLGRAVLLTSKDNGTVKSQTATSYDQAAPYPQGGATISDGDETITAPLNGSGQTYTGAPVTGTVTDAAGRTVQLDQYTTLPAVSVTTTGTTPVTTAVAIPPASGTAQATDYGFDAAGDQTTVTDEATASGTPQTWTSGYNLLGQVTSREDPDTGLTSGMQYDFNGNLLQSTDSLGKTISVTYDALNRKTAEYDAATPAQAGGNELASWAYDNSNGAVPGMTDPAGQLTTSTSYAGRRRRQRLHPAGRRVHRPRRAHRRDRHHPAGRGRARGLLPVHAHLLRHQRRPGHRHLPRGRDAARRDRHPRLRLRERPAPAHRPGRHRRLHRQHHLDPVEPARHPGNRRHHRQRQHHQRLRPAHRRPDRRQAPEHRRRVARPGRHVLHLRPRREPRQPDRDPQRRHVRDPVLRLRHPGPAQAGMDRDRRLRRRPVGGLRRHRRRRDPRRRLLDELDLHPPRPAPDRDRPRPQRRRRRHHHLRLRRQRQQPARHPDRRHHRQRRHHDRVLGLHLRHRRRHHQPLGHDRDHHQRRGAHLERQRHPRLRHPRHHHPASPGRLHHSRLQLRLRRLRRAAAAEGPRQRRPARGNHPLPARRAADPRHHHRDDHRLPVPRPARRRPGRPHRPRPRHRRRDAGLLLRALRPARHRDPADRPRPDRRDRDLAPVHPLRRPPRHRRHLGDEPRLPRQAPGHHHRPHQHRRPLVRPRNRDVPVRRPRLRAIRPPAAQRLHLRRSQPHHRQRPHRTDEGMLRRLHPVLAG